MTVLKDRASPSGPVTGIKKTSVTIPLASLAANTGAAESTVAVADALTGDVVTLNPRDSTGAGLRALSGARVTADGVVGVKYVNQSTATIAASTVDYDLYLQRR